MKRTAAALFLTVGFLLPSLSVVAAVAAPTETEFEKRCGWFHNPSPANTWLFDRDGEWTIGKQGGHQVDGDWEWPLFKPKQWVRTNINYGYGCACLEAQVDRKTQEVRAIKSARARPLATCRQDPSLKKWEKRFK